MSIKEVGDKSKPSPELPTEEEFDIVPVGVSPKNKATLSHHTFTVVAIILVASISFAIGKLVQGNAAPSVSLHDDTEEVIAPKPTHEDPQSQAVANVTGAISKRNENDTQTAPVAAVSGGPIVASKNGTKYYSLNCSGAKRIKEENKIFFASAGDAQKAGLSPSSTCKDLK